MILGQVQHEKQYILDELRKLVRQNKDLTSDSLIEQKVQEFESRIETGLHYKIPYPRPVNVAPGSTGKDPATVTPVYLHSYKQQGGSTSTRRKPNTPVYDE